MEYTTDQAKGLCERYGALKALRQPWETLWEEISNYVMPRRSPGQTGTIQPNNSKESRLFDTTAVQANMVLANGCMAWMSPMEGVWFSFTPSAGVTDDPLKQWLSKCTTASREELTRSNFYTAVHEFYLDRSAFGTACLYVEPGKKTKFNVQCWPVGSFVIDEDDEHMVDTVIREFKLTARQAEMKFGKEKLSKELQKVLEKADPKTMQETTTFLHFIMPRPVNERKIGPKGEGAMADENLPIASVYVEKDNHHVCKVGGYYEMPVFVSRYLEWGSGMGRLYGWSPSFAALPEARQLNFLQMMLDAQAEKLVFPPILAPAGMEGLIDVNSNAITYFSPELSSDAMPKEWATAGQYSVGKDRVLERQNAVNRAFHVDLFQMFSQLDKQMTAREVTERSSEKLIQFSPTFARLTTELFNPFLECIFGIGLRSGLFGATDAIPQAARMSLGNGQDFVPLPTVQYSSRIAQALRALPVLSLHRMIELVLPLAQMNPEVLDNFDWDEAVRMVALVESLPEGIMRDLDKVIQMRDARAEQQAEAMKLQQAELMANAAGKLGSIPSGSPVGQALNTQLQAAA